MKKKFKNLAQVDELLSNSSEISRATFYKLKKRIEKDGYLSPPFMKPIDEFKEMRIMTIENIRIFYAKGINDIIWGFYGFIKKSKKTSKQDLKNGIKIYKLLRSQGLIK